MERIDLVSADYALLRISSLLHIRYTIKRSVEINSDMVQFFLCFQLFNIIQ